MSTFEGFSAETQRIIRSSTRARRIADLGGSEDQILATPAVVAESSESSESVPVAEVPAVSDFEYGEDPSEPLPPSVEEDVQPQSPPLRVRPLVDVDAVVLELAAELVSAEAKHGEQSINHLPASSHRWMAILAEEVGEVAHALTYDVKASPVELRRELVQVAAVALAWARVL